MRGFAAGDEKEISHRASEETSDLGREKSSLVQPAAKVRPAGWGECERMCAALKVHASHG